MLLWRMRLRLRMQHRWIVLRLRLARVLNKRRSKAAAVEVGKRRRNRRNELVACATTHGLMGVFTPPPAEPCLPSDTLTFEREISSPTIEQRSLAGQHLVQLTRRGLDLQSDQAWLKPMHASFSIISKYVETTPTGHIRIEERQDSEYSGPERLAHEAYLNQLVDCDHDFAITTFHLPYTCKGSSPKSTPCLQVSADM